MTEHELRFPDSTPFTDAFIQENRLYERGFQDWIFHPGMLFHSMDKWWGDMGKRGAPHEGLDLCLYRDSRDKARRLDEKTAIPVMYGGEVIRIVKDFLGESLVVKHDRFHGENSNFFTIYGHVDPRDGIREGHWVDAGEIVASLADTRGSKSGVPPHLHITLGWISKSVPEDRLDWSCFAAPDLSKLLDPLPFVSCR